MKSAKLYLFGVPRLERGGESVNPSRRKVVALIALLALARQPQSRDTLAALLWPDHDQASTRANLRRGLSPLKGVLGHEYLKSDRNQAEIVHTPAFWLDIAAFNDKLARVREHHPNAPQICGDCAALLTEAIALYQDDFLTGFALSDSTEFDDWHYFQSEALHHDLAQALQSLINWYVDRGQVDRALGYGRRRVALDGLHEPAQRRLMQLYAWSG